MFTTQLEEEEEEEEEEEGDEEEKEGEEGEEGEEEEKEEEEEEDHPVLISHYSCSTITESHAGLRLLKSAVQTDPSMSRLIDFTPS